MYLINLYQPTAWWTHLFDTPLASTASMIDDIVCAWGWFSAYLYFYTSFVYVFYILCVLQSICIVLYNYLPDYSSNKIADDFNNNIYVMCLFSRLNY